MSTAEFISAAAPFNAQHVYALNQPTRPRPNYGPLCAFHTLKAARNFRGSSTNHAIFRAEVAVSKQTAIYTPYAKRYDKQSLALRNHMHIRDFILCDEITLLERII